MVVYSLDKAEIAFPDPRAIPAEERDPDGLLAVGGDLQPERLMLAYSWGIFPWTPKVQDEFEWYCPMDRFVIFPAEIHISHSMRQMMRRGDYTVTFDKDFDAVIDKCSGMRIHHRYAWLDGRMVEAYKRLAQMGVCHSVEVWDREGKLVGGLYGVSLRGGFFGESMFSDVPSASKLALIALAQKMQAEGGKLIDCQFETPHLKSMGGRHISYDEYLRLLGHE